MRLLATVNLTSTSFFIDFNNIPAAPGSLFLVLSGRGGGNGPSIYFEFNGGTGTSYTTRWLQGLGSSVSAASNSLTFSRIDGGGVGPDYTANTFAKISCLIPNFSSSTAPKTATIEVVSENNNTPSRQIYANVYWAHNTPISRFRIAVDGDWQVNSSASLYIIS